MAKTLIPRILTRYVMARVGVYMLGALVFLVLLQVLFGVLGGRLAWQTLVRHSYQMIPVAVLLGAVLGLSVMGSELVAMRAVGFGKKQVARAVVLPALLLALVGLLITEIYPKNTSPAPYADAWQDGARVVVITMQSVRDDKIVGITRYEFDRAKLIGIKTLSQLDYHDGYGGSAQGILPPNFAPPSVLLERAHGDKLSTSTLWSHLKYDKSAPKAYFWARVAGVLTTVTQALLACQFVFFASRSRPVAVFVVGALSLGLLVHYLGNVLVMVAIDTHAYGVVFLPCVLCFYGAYCLQKI